MTAQTIALLNSDLRYALPAFAAILAAFLVAAVIFGARRWQRPGGKAITIIEGLLLLILAIGAGFLLLLGNAMEWGNTL